MVGGSTGKGTQPFYFCFKQKARPYTKPPNVNILSSPWTRTEKPYGSWLLISDAGVLPSGDRDKQVDDLKRIEIPEIKS